MAQQVRKYDHWNSIDQRFKRAAEKYFPRTFLDRPKWGFGIPLARWFDGEPGNFADEMLDNDAHALAGLVDPEEVRRIWREYRAGRADKIGQVWNLLALRFWRDHALTFQSALALV